MLPYYIEGTIKKKEGKKSLRNIFCMRDIYKDGLITKEKWWKDSKVVYPVTWFQNTYIFTSFTRNILLIFLTLER